MDSLQWMGAIRMRVQTADKNITIIHTTPVHQSVPCEAKSCVSVRNFKRVFYQWYYFLQFKSRLVWIRREICTDQSLITSQNSSKRFDGFWCERTIEHGLFHWRKLYYGLWTGNLARSNGLNVKSLMTDLFLTIMQLFTSQDIKCWTGVTCGLLWCFYQFGLSFWRHPFTAEDPLVSKWCNAKFLQICSVE